MHSQHELQWKAAMMRSSRMILGFGWLLAGMVQGAEFPNPFFPHLMVRTQMQVVERPSTAEGVPLTSCGPLIGVILIAGAACARVGAARSSGRAVGRCAIAVLHAYARARHAKRLSARASYPG